MKRLALALLTLIVLVSALALLTPGRATRAQPQPSPTVGATATPTPGPTLPELPPLPVVPEGLVSDAARDVWGMIFDEWQDTLLKLYAVWDLYAPERNLMVEALAGALENAWGDHYECSQAADSLSGEPGIRAHCVCELAYRAKVDDIAGSLQANATFQTFREDVEVLIDDFRTDAEHLIDNAELPLFYSPQEWTVLHYEVGNLLTRLKNERDIQERIYLDDLDWRYIRPFRGQIEVGMAIWCS